MVHYVVVRVNEGVVQMLDVLDTEQEAIDFRERYISRLRDTGYHIELDKETEGRYNLFDTGDLDENENIVVESVGYVGVLEWRLIK